MPTIDPKDLPSTGQAGRYEVTNFQTNLQRSFERWLESPSPTSERLVDQSLVSAGREPMFSRGRATGQPASFPRPYTGAMRPPPFRDTRGRFSNPGYSGPGFAAPQYNGPSYTQQASSYRGGDAYVERNQTSTRELTRLFKNIDKNLASIDRIDNQILELEKTSIGGARGPTRMIPSWIPGGPARAYQPLLGGAIPAGLGIPPRPPGNVTFSNPGGPGFQVTPPPGGTGGGGGGRGGGGNAFAGGLFGSALGRNGWAAAAGEAAALGARWPLHLGHALQGLLRSSSPYTDWQTRLADMTALPASRERSGSARRVGLERDLLPYAGGAVPEWMSKLGLTPSSAAEILDRMGGGVQTGTEPLQMIQNFRELRLGAGFRMAPEGSAEALGMMGQKYGITQPGGQAAFPGTFAQYMAQGQSGGADVKDLLKSISESTEALVKTGIKLDLSQTTGWADFLQRMLTVNLPSAQAGQMGGQIISGMQGAGQHPFANPVTSTIFSQLINQTDWNDPEQVKRLLGKTPEEIMSGGADWQKTGLGMLQQGKTSPLAMLYGSRMISGSPEGLARIGDIVGQMGGGGAQGDAIRQMLMGSFLGQDYVTGSGALAGIKAQKPADIPGAATPLDGTLPSEVFRSQTEAFTAAFRGMRADFEEFGSKIHWVNNLLDGIIDRLGRLFGREVFPGGVPGIPLGGQKIPGGYEAPVPGFGGAAGGAGGGGRMGAGSAPPSFGAAGEYGAGQGTTPSGGSRVPSAPGGGSAGSLGREGWYNNPGNIRLGGGDWVGKGDPYGAGSSGQFETFASPELGVRAAVKNIQAKFTKGQTTPTQIANILGPASDNNNPGWLAKQYADALGIGVNDPIPNTQEAFNKLIPAITNIEKPYDARPRYTPEVYRKGIAAAFDDSLTASLPGASRSQVSSTDPTGGKGGRFSWGRINPLSISPALADTLPLSASALPPGYTLQGKSGHRPGDSGAHGSRMAGDFEILDPQNRPIPGNEGDDSTGLYKKWAHGWYNAVLQKHPELARKARWGGEFGTQKGGGGPDDNMHVDFWADVAGSYGSRTKQGWRFADPDALAASIASDATSTEPNRSPVQVDRAPAPSNSGIGKDEYGGGGHQSFNWDDVHDAVGFLGRMARETGEHLSDLGHGARSAGRGMSSTAGPNTSTSPTPNPAAAAYP